MSGSRLPDSEETKNTAEEYYKALTEALKAKNYSAAEPFVNTCLEVLNEYSKTVAIGRTATKAQDAFSKLSETYDIKSPNSEIHKNFNDANKLAKDTFKNFRARIETHYASGKNKVPPLPANLKEQVDPQFYAELVTFRNKVVDSKNTGDKIFKDAQEVNAKVIEVSNAVAKQRNGSHGLFSQNDSQAKAQAAKGNGQVAPLTVKQGKA